MGDCHYSKLLSPRGTTVEAATDGESGGGANTGPGCRALCPSEQGAQNRGVHIYCCDFLVQVELETRASGGMGTAFNLSDLGESHQARHKISKLPCSLQKVKTRI